VRSFLLLAALLSLDPPKLVEADLWHSLLAPYNLWMVAQMKTAEVL